MICYHTTDSADEIRRNGFRDATGSYMITTELTGVFLGERPMDINDGAKGDQVLRVEFPDDVDLDDFELKEDEKHYREWCVPAAPTCKTRSPDATPGDGASSAETPSMPEQLPA